MKNKSKNTVWQIIGFLVIVGAMVLIALPKKAETSELADFAQCLSDNGAKFYGAHWCPHCKNQKEAFGPAAKYLPYIECATPSGQGQQKVCVDNNITSYPTWVFADGSRESGNLSLSTLATKTNCTLPS